MPKSWYLLLRRRIILTLWFLYLLCGSCRRCVAWDIRSSSSFCGDRDSCLSRTCLKVSLSNTCCSKCRTCLPGSWAVLSPSTCDRDRGQELCDAELCGRGTWIITRGLPAGMHPSNKASAMPRASDDEGGTRAVLDVTLPFLRTSAVCTCQL